MTTTLLRRTPMAAALLALAFTAAPNISAAKPGYYDRGAEGWFWYKEKNPVEVEEPKKEEKKPEEPKVIVMQAPPAEEPEPAKEAGPAALSAAWFRENLQVYLDKAIDDPSPENVQAYFLLQRVMMDKAQDFSDVSRRVVMGDPILDESNRRSLDPSTSRLQEDLSSKRRVEALNYVTSKAGIVYFFDSECDLCDNQAANLKHLQERTGIEVMAVSLDGQPLRSGYFADNMTADQGQAAAMGVSEGPALFLVAPPDKWIALAHSVITQEEAVTRILLAANETGILTDDEFNRTKPINITPSLANVLPADGSLPDNTNELIQFLRNMEQR